jgi:hypothetical protein
MLSLLPFGASGSDFLIDFGPNYCHSKQARKDGMATATITLTDGMFGTIEVSGDIDPPIIAGEERSPAQELGFRLLQEFYEMQEQGRLQRMKYSGMAVKEPDGQN